MKYMCPPMSRANLRAYAQNLRKDLQLQNTEKFPAVEFLETLPHLIQDDSLYYDYIPDLEWENPKAHAYYDLTENCVKVKESIYIGACNDNGRDRMTIVHECCHVLLLHYSHLTLTRTFDDNIPAYQDPEWQAKCLAGELMIPLDLVGNLSATEVATRCAVSVEAAVYQLRYRY